MKNKPYAYLFILSMAISTHLMCGLGDRNKGFGIVNKAEIDVFLELSCFFHDPVYVGNLISGSSAFSITSLNIREFTVHVLLKPGLENFEDYFISMCCC